MPEREILRGQGKNKTPIGGLFLTTDAGGFRRNRTTTRQQATFFPPVRRQPTTLYDATRRKCQSGSYTFKKYMRSPSFLLQIVIIRFHYIMVNPCECLPVIYNSLFDCYFILKPAFFNDTSRTDIIRAVKSR